MLVRAGVFQGGAEETLAPIIQMQAQLKSASLHQHMYFAPGLKHSAIPSVHLNALRRRVGHSEEKDDNVQLQAWLAARGTATDLHFSQSHNFVAQLRGRKRFTLLPPRAHQFVRVFPFWHGSFRQARDGGPLAVAATDRVTR